MERRARKFKQNMEKAFMGITGAVVGMTAAMGAAASMSAKFENQLIEVQKVTSPKTMEKMGEEIEDMANKMPLAHEGLVQITSDAGRMGIKGVEALTAFTKTVARLSVATELTAEDAGRSLGKLTKWLNIPAKYARNLGAAINKLSNNIPADADEIVRTLGKTGQQFEILGASTTTTLALSGAVSALADSAERGGTRMRRLLQQLQEPSTIEDMAKAFDMTGEELRDMIKRSPVKAILKLAKAFKRGGKQADILREALASTSEVTLTVLANNLDMVNNALDMTGKQLENPTSLMKEFKAAISTTVSQLKMLWNAIKNVIMNALGERANEVLKNVIKNMRGWALAVEDLIDGNKELRKAIFRMVKAALHIGGIITLAGLAFKALSLLISPVTAITAGLLLMGAAWRYNAFGIKDFVNNKVVIFFEDLSTAVSDMSKSLKDFPDSPLKAIGDFWDKIKKKDQDTKINLAVGGFLAFWAAKATIGAALAGVIASLASFITHAGPMLNITLGAGVGFAIDQVLEKKTSIGVKKSQIIGATGGALIAAPLLPFVSTPQAMVGIVLTAAFALAIEEIMDKQWGVFIKKADLIDKISHVLKSSSLGVVGAGLGWLVAGPPGAAVGFVLTATIAFAFMDIEDSTFETKFDKKADKITDDAKKKIEEKAAEKGLNIDFKKLDTEDFRKRITELNKLYNKFMQQGGDIKDDGLERMKELLKEIKLIMDKLDIATNPPLKKLLTDVGNIFENKKEGGPVGLQKGGMAGYVPGTGTGDIIPAMLEPGEFVWPKQMVEKMPWIENMWKGFKFGGKVEEGRTHYKARLTRGTTNEKAPDWLMKLYLNPPSWIKNVKTFRGDVEALMTLVRNFKGLQKDMNKVQEQAGEKLKELRKKVEEATNGEKEAKTALGKFINALNWSEKKLAKSMGITTDTLSGLRSVISTVTNGFMEVAEATGKLSAGTSARLGGIMSAAQSALSGNWLQAAMDLFTGFMTGWIEDLKAEKKKLQKKLDTTFSMITDGLKSLTQEINNLVGSLAGPFSNAISGALDGFVGFFKMTQQFVQGNILDMMQAGFSALLSIVTGVTSSLIGLLQKSNQWEALQSELEPIWQALANALGTLLTPLVALARWLREYLGISKDVGEDMEEIADLNVPAGFKRARKVWEAAAPGQPVGTAGGDGGGMKIPEWAKQIIKPIKEKLIPYLKGSKDFLGLIETWAKNAWKWIQKLILEWIPRFFDILEAVGQWVANIDWETIFGYIGDAMKWFADNFPDAWDKFKTVFGEFMQGAFGEKGFLWQIDQIRQTLNAIAKSMGIAAGAIGGAGLGAAIGGAFGGPLGAIIGGGIGAAVGGLAGWLGFQEGGIVTDPTPGIVGEAGPEAVIPLDRMGDFGNNLTVEIKTSGDGVADQIIDEIQVKNKRLTGSRSTSAALNRRTYS